MTDEMLTTVTVAHTFNELIAQGLVPPPWTSPLGLTEISTTPPATPVTVPEPSIVAASASSARSISSRRPSGERGFCVVYTVVRLG